MKKTLVLLLIVTASIIAGCSQTPNIPQAAETQALSSGTASFKAEYEGLNDNDHPFIQVPSDINIHILDFSGVQQLLTQGDGILFFGFPSCPWCRNLLPELFTSMQKNGIKELYYFNPKEIRDQKELINGEIVDKKPTNSEYQWLLQRLDSILPAYQGLNNPKIKRLYVPAVLFLQKGEILNYHFDTLPEQKDPQIPLTTAQKTKLQDLLSEKMKDLISVGCAIPVEGQEQTPSC